MRTATAALATALVAAGCGGDSLLSFLPACGAGPPVLFTTSPIADSDFTGLAPLGAVRPPGQTFPASYVSFFVPRDGDANRSVPVVAPGAVTLWRVESLETLGGSPPRSDYTLRFASCSNVSAYFQHVQTLDPALVARLGSLDDAACTVDQVGATALRSCAKYVRVDLAAGEAIGTAGGVSQPALDFGLGDNRQPPLPYVDKTRDDFDPLHAACPIDYYRFDGATRDLLFRRFSNALGTVHRSANPVCGTIAQDLSGTVQGRWFAPDTTRSTPEDAHLALVHDNVDPSLPLFSVGTSIPGFAGTWTFTPVAEGTINRDFRDVGLGAIYCWNVSGWPALPEGVGWRVVAYMPDSTRLFIEARSAARCEDAPPALTDAAIEFVR